MLISQAHKLSQRPYLAMQDLREEKFALDSTAKDYAAVIIRACREAGFEPTINGRCHGFEVVRAMSAAGCSISIQPGLRSFDGPGDVCVREIRPAIKRKISAAYRAGELRNPAVKAFVTELKTIAKIARDTRLLGG